MEFEIDDEPQGLPDRPEGDRDGGLREHLFVRKSAPAGNRAPGDQEAPATQLGELV